MRITRACDYAFRAMVYLAGNAGQAVETATVAQEVDVPPVYLRKIFQSLARAGLVRTTAGSGGGVMLVPSANDVTLKDIIEAVEGPIVLSDCVDHPGICTRSANCKTKPYLADIETRIHQEFSAHKLSDLL